jgi:hypothetical protein
MLSNIIENWVHENTVKNRFSTLDATENMMLFEQVRIPLFNEKGQATDTRRWAFNLKKFTKFYYMTLGSFSLKKNKMAVE